MNIKNYIEILKLNNLFNNFSKNQLLNIFDVNNHKICKYNKNKIIHFESENCLYFDIILEGQVVVQRIDENGNVLTIAQFNTGDTMGANLLFGSNNLYPMSIIAKSDSIVLHIKKAFILELCHNDKSFLLEFLKDISNKGILLTNKIKSISMKTLRDSIIDFLNYEYYLQKKSKINLYITKKELAERFGVQRTSLSRELNKMKKNKLISYDANSITIENLDIIKKNN